MLRITPQKLKEKYLSTVSQGNGQRKAVYLGDEDGIDFGIVFKVLKDLHTFSLRCGSINIRSEKKECKRDVLPFLR